MHDSPKEESLWIDEHLEVPDDVDVMDDPPGDDDRSDEEPDAPWESVKNGDGDTEGGNPSLSVSREKAESLLLPHEDLREGDLVAGSIEGWSTDSWVANPGLFLLLIDDSWLFNVV